jgi:hypothetical protein
MGALGPEFLDRTALTIILCGVGFGEGALVALPDKGWLAIDGSGPKSQPPSVTLLEKLIGDDLIDAVLLTHPHEDHYYGIVELLDHPVLGPRVQKVGCVAEYVGTKSTLDLERDARHGALDLEDPRVRTDLGRTLTVLERIKTTWSDTPACRLPLRRGLMLPLSATGVSAEVLWPEPKAIHKLFGAPADTKKVLAHANQLSAVIELRFGKTRVLLGGDLPYLHAGTLLDSGWHPVIEAAPGLNAHTGLKVPHHGSVEALAPALLAKSAEGSPPRTWMVTPFNKHELPFEPKGGGQQLLEKEEEFLLTSLPVGFRHQQPGAARVPYAQIQRDIVTLKKPSGRLGVVVAAGRSTPVEPLDCVWAITFDSNGNVLKRHRGRVALAVTR